MNSFDYNSTAVHEPELKVDIEPEPIDNQPEAETKTKTRKRRAPRKTSINEATVKRVLDSAELFSAADSETRSLAALLLETTNEIPKLVASALSSGGKTETDSDVRLVVSSPLATRGIQAMQLDRPRQRAVWLVLQELGFVQGNYPSTEAAAAIAIAEADIDAQSILASLDNALDLIEG